MTRRSAAAALSAIVLVAPNAIRAQSFKVARYDIGGDGGTDYVTAEPDSRRVFVSRGNHVMVVDGATGKVIGDIPDTPRMHGVALAPKWNHGFTTNAGDSTVTMFDTKTLAAIRKIPVSTGGLDGIMYDASTDRVILTNHSRPAGTAVALDAKSGDIVGTAELEDTAPEGAASDGRGRLYVNNEGTSTIQVLDAKSMRVLASWPLAPCDGPTGIAYDRATERIFSGCSRTSVVLDARTGKVVATVANGDGVDALGWDPMERLMYIPAGRSGNVTVVHQDAPDKYTVVATVPTMAGAKTITVDTATHTAYLFQPEYGPAPAGAPPGPGGRPARGPVVAAWFFAITTEVLSFRASSGEIGVFTHSPGFIMTRLVRFITLIACAACTAAQGTSNPDAARWEEQAKNVTITRDDWGIAHVHGKTDADAVFGMIYAQAEDDFNRVETNFINAMGRLAESEGEKEIYRDLRMKLFIDPDSMKAKYESSPEWLKSLMNGWADGLNFYLYRHPEVKPKVITKFEPWMALTFSEGSIGGDIERISTRELERFYGGSPDTKMLGQAESSFEPEPTGSNGIAIGPSMTATKHAMLLINPHTSFFFRAESQVTSDEGLNAYGASTWGQFFIYQGFNDRVGWMHTSSGVDNIDEYAETIVKKGDRLFYKYGNEERPLITQKITVPYKSANGIATKEFTVYRTHHGPIVREANGKWISTRLMQEPVKALTQSYSRTKAKSYDEFRKVMDLHTNSSNNTLFASADGDFAYFHANFIPKRDPKFDWTKPVDGSNPATEWGDVLSVEESPLVHNPPNGWVYNTNNWPYSAAASNSPKRAAFATYVESGVENPRGIHAIRVLENRKGWTLDSLLAAAFDSYLTAFDPLLPPLFAAYDRTAATDATKKKVAEQVEMLRSWDRRWGVESVPTSLAVFWGEELWRMVRADAESEDMTVYDYMARRTKPAQLLGALAAASDSLTADFGTWKTPWGDINRFQRLTGDIVQPFTDSGPSIPVGFTSSRWGSLASFGARPYPNTKKWYGTSGNSFVAVVEFGDSVRARAVTAGGESGDPKSPHFNDQAQRYATGNLREVYFYPSQLEGHTQRRYSPGQ